MSACLCAVRKPCCRSIFVLVRVLPAYVYACFPNTRISAFVVISCYRQRDPQGRLFVVVGTGCKSVLPSLACQRIDIYSLVCCYWQKEASATLHVLKQRPDLLDFSIDLMKVYGDAVFAAK